MFFDERFDWQPRKNGVPLFQNGGLPQPSHTAIAIGEWVDKFELVVKNATFDERVNIAYAKPLKQIGHQSWNHFGRRRNMNHATAIENAYANGAVAAVSHDQIFHHKAMRVQQIVFVVWVQFEQKIVGLDSVFYLLNFVWRAQHAFSLHNGSHLLKAQCVVFYGQRRMNGPDSVLFAQFDVAWRIGKQIDLTYFFRNTRNKVDDSRCNMERRCVH